MRRYTGKRMGLALMLLACVLRFFIAAGLETAAKAVLKELEAPAFRRLVLAVGTGSYPEALPEEESRLFVLKKAAAFPEPVQPAVPPASEELTFTDADANAVTVAGACTYPVDKQALLALDTALPADEAPAVLIVHTHTSEAYTQTAGWLYEESDRLRTTQPDRSVVRVGEEIAAVLEARGIRVIHDKSYNDYPDYSGSYTRTMAKTKQWLAEEPSIQVVLDIHRDALETADGTPLHTASTLSDGTAAARLMLVVGTDQGGTDHPHWKQNLSWALKVQAVLERTEPGLCRSLDLRTERFNQHLSPRAMLVEVGSTGNTMPEALAAARVFAEALARVMTSG